MTAASPIAPRAASVAPAPVSASAAPARAWLDRLHAAAAALPAPVSFMEVCGTHTMEAFRCGLHSLMPPNVTLLSGPGCPVCVTSQGDIDALIELARRPGVTLCTYGDMLRVPGAAGSLELARSRGADIRVVYSVRDAVKLAAATPSRPVVFAAVGFETTAPATAAGILAAEARGLGNFSVVVSHKRVVPAMLALLQTEVKLAGFLCPGHVSVIIGARAYEPVVTRHHMRCVIGGFEGPQIAAALARLTEQARDGQVRLENLYPEAVTDEGNPAAQAVMYRVFEPGMVWWRAIGALPASGLVLRPEYRRFDALARFGVTVPASREPPGCRCGEVITGRCTPHDCGLFAGTCTPVNPVGPCMVSSEGTCQAYFKYHRRPARPGPDGTVAAAAG